MKKIILFNGGIETLAFFSLELNKAFIELGYSTFIYNLDDKTAMEFKNLSSLRKTINYKNGINELIDFIEPENTVLITFNFNGIRGEEEFYGKTALEFIKKASKTSVGHLSMLGLKKDFCFWDKYNIECINIVVDHPFYYHEMLPLLPIYYSQVSIDKEHEAYLKKYYPEIKSAGFMPSGGTKIINNTIDDKNFDNNFNKVSFFDFIPLNKRRHDIIFTGNYTPPEKFNAYITRNGKEYEEFYKRIIDELIAYPDSSIDCVFEKYLNLELDASEKTPENIRICMSSMIFIDLYVRFYYRGLVIKTLAENGHKIYVLGSGWQLLKCSRPENIINSNATMTDSLTCLKEIADSKISINVMPWFKNGAHDRIFNSMLNGALSFTDKSKYLNEKFTDLEDIAFYDLKQIDEIPDKMSMLLNNSKLVNYIIENSMKKALKDTWYEKAVFLSDIIGN